MVWGADYLIDLTKPVGQRITSLVVKGHPVVPTDTFTLALSSYRQAGPVDSRCWRGRRSSMIAVSRSAT